MQNISGWLFSKIQQLGKSVFLSIVTKLIRALRVGRIKNNLERSKQPIWTSPKLLKNKAHWMYFEI